MDVGEEFLGQQTIVGHGVEDASLPQKHDQHHAGESSECAEGDDVGGAGQSSIQESAGDGGFDVDFAPGHHAGQHGSDQNVEDGADHQRSNNSYGQIALRVLGFLGGGGDRIKSDVGEEDISRACADAGESHGGKCVPVSAPVAGAQVAEAQSDDEQHHRHLDDDDGGVK